MKKRNRKVVRKDPRYFVPTTEHISKVNRRLYKEAKMKEFLKVQFDISHNQGCHVSGKSQGKTKFSPGQGIVREF